MARFDLGSREGRITTLNQMIRNIREAARDILISNATPALTLKQDGTTITEKDKKTEEFLRARFSRDIGVTGWVGEETEAKEARYVWMVDPIDGTTNFGLGGEYWTISVALADREKKEIILGAVYQPSKNKLYHFEQYENDSNAWLERDTIRPELTLRALSPSASKAFTEFVITAYGPSKHMKDRTELAKKIAQVYEEMPVPGADRKYKMLQGRRGAGCASLTLCRIAEGEEHGAILLSQSPWDIAAGIMIAKTAGCLLYTTISGITMHGANYTEEIIATAKKDTLIDVYCFANPEVEKIVMEQFNK